MREETYMLRQKVAFYRERLSLMVQEKESLTMAAEVYSENTFNQNKRTLGLASSFPSKISHITDPEMRQRSVSTCVPNHHPTTAVHKFEQLKRSFTDSIKISPPIIQQELSRCMSSVDPLRYISPSDPLKYASSGSSESHTNSVGIEERRKFIHSLLMERPCAENILPWNSIASSRPSEFEVNCYRDPLLDSNENSFQDSCMNDTLDLKAPKLTRSASTRKAVRSLCAPSNFLSNP